MLELYDDLKIYSKYGEDWDHQVDELCDEVDFDTCLMLRATVDKGYTEMSIQQLDHMWQISRSGQFEEYNPDFCDGDGNQNDHIDFPIENINNEIFVTNFYVQGDSYCDPET